MHKGAVNRITQHLDKFLLKLACRHHILELRVEKFYNILATEATSGPDNATFKHLKSKMENPEFELNYSNLCFYDKGKVVGTILEKQARDSALFCKAYIARKEVIREDRRELAELVLLYLGEKKDLKIRKAGAVHHARFLSKAIYTLKIVLLANQVEFDRNTLESLKQVSEFVCCFYAVWYLQSHEAVRAPYADLSAIHQMIRFEE